MKKLSVFVFRKYIVNLIIIAMVVILGGVLFVGGTTQVFGQNSYDVFYNGNKNSKNVSLMFNVYQGSEYIEEILTILGENNAKATFFVGGSWAVKNSELLQKIVDQGHEIGNHGYWHKDHKNLSIEKNLSEMELTHKVVKSLAGYDIKLFAPPSGSYSQSTLKAAQQMGYKTVMWTLDTIDWRDSDCELIFSRATKKLAGGNLILMHPTEATKCALPKIISQYLNNGYNLTTVSENIL